jgi:hypothetical protein
LCSRGDKKEGNPAKACPQATAATKVTDVATKLQEGPPRDR